MTKILRISLPQWQGGNRPEYYVGSKLLEFLAPQTKNETIYIPVSQNPTDGTIKDGIVAKEIILQQTKDTFKAISEKNPDKLIIFGGDCSIALTPFSYLLEKYDPAKTGVLWIDSHMDIFTSENFQHYHAMVVSTLLGHGDKEFSKLVPKKLLPKHIVYAGINDTNEKDRKLYRRYQFPTFGKNDIEKNPNIILNTLKEKGIEHLLIHFDLDVLSLNDFRSTYFAELPIYDKSRNTMPEATSLPAIIKLIQQANKSFNLVGLGIAEHLPWDAIILQKLLANLPLVSE